MSHKHWFHAIWCHFGQFGPQDVHYHPCVNDEPGECHRVVVGKGRECSGEPGDHERMTLTEDGPRKRARAALAEERQR